MTSPSSQPLRAATDPELFIPSGESVVEMAGVGVRRGTKDLLSEVSWQVREGERWIIMGPNGAGKSTLLQVASTRMHPTTGMVGILDEVLGAVDVFELRPRIGLSSAALAQQLPDGETVLNAVLTASWGVMGRWNESYDTVDEERARRLIWQWGLRGYEDRRFGTLSEGERKRVLVARALMTDPELLLLDEPAAGLDLAGRETLVRALARLASDPSAPALVLVTHHVEEVPPGFTHALLMRQGRVVAAGPLEQTLTEDHLSTAFGLPLKVTRVDGRYTAVAR
ncbi:iron complex transport system ATP-binding protein [Citricoccus muralis]|uniref:Iron complex transport system ATP-binding protein n=2 Tax=Citricoccus muralis TaxID=169134 RepID=A0A3D9LD23_9MICC|nr:iron complex transport system ATP-binding protein [Citricoccus muralis]